MSGCGKTSLVFTDTDDHKTKYFNVETKEVTDFLQDMTEVLKMEMFLSFLNLLESVLNILQYM